MRRLGPRSARRANRRSPILTATAGNTVAVAAGGGGGGSNRLGCTTVTVNNPGAGPYSSLQIGGIFTAGVSFVATTIHGMAGISGISAGTAVRLNVYAVSGTTWGALLGSGDIAGGFTSLQDRSVALSVSVTITSGQKYGLGAQAAASCEFTESGDSASDFWADAYSDGAANPAGATTPNISRTPFIYITD